MINGKPLQGQDVANQILDQLFDNPSKGCLIYFDPDLDGLVSGLFFAQLLAKHDVKFTYHVNTNRQHGFLMSEADVDRYSGYTFLSGDFMVRHSTMQLLTERYGISYLSSDHHENPDGFGVFSSPSSLALSVLLNNQFPSEPTDDHFQSGAGVVLDIVSHYDPSLLTDTNLALVGMTLLSDVRDIEAPRAKPFLDKLYSMSLKSDDQYIRYLISEVTKHSRPFGFGVPVLDRNFVDFKLSPAVNSLFRWGRETEAVGFILGRGYPSHNYHQDQKDLINLMAELVSVTEYPSITFIEIDLNNRDLAQYREHVPSFVGVLASRFVEPGKSALCYSVDHGQVTRASFRGTTTSGDYLTRINQSGVATLVGHEAACGVKDFTPTANTFTQIDQICSLIDSSWSLTDSSWSPDRNVYQVDSLKMLADNGYIKKLATVNQYRLRENFLRLKYTGSNATLLKFTDKYQRWKVDGQELTAFNTELTPNSGIIYPELDRNNVVLFLKET